jgi:Do/DeqQ family serine protease
MTIAIALGLLLLVAGSAGAQTDAAATPVTPRAILKALEDAFTAVVDRVAPAVVNVSTTPRRAASAPPGDDPDRFREFFGDELYERYFRRRPESVRANGSGVIVDPNGYILTNSHVIENAQDITVRLADARRFTARVIGSDPKTDLAVLKVDAPAPLPAAELGDSDALRVGQWAIAIGHPFGLDRTVTVGIVSATARTRVGVATYENFIQTDASINPGNSGGPLLNIDGRVVGVNTAIVATGQGIGFAIPINMARDIMRQLVARGRVVRGWLGIVIQDVNEELARSFGVAERDGVLVADVMQGGPGDAAGLRPGDVIVEFAGARVREVPELQRVVAGAAPGDTVALVVVREGARVQASVTLGEMPGGSVTVLAPDDQPWGLEVDPLTDELRQRLGLTERHGVVVTAVAPGRPAARAGLQRGDVILALRGRPIADPAALYRELGALKPGETVPLFVRRADGGRSQYLVLERPAP